MTRIDLAVNSAVAILELAALFAVCVWGFEQNAFAGLAAPALLGIVWHRWITPRLPTAPVAD